MIGFQGSQRNVWVLFFAQAMMMCLGSTVVFAGGIIGTELAPRENLSTLPVAAMIIGTAVSVIPANLLMKRFGRKSIFLATGILAIGYALFAGHAIIERNFTQFVAACLLLGSCMSVIMQFRFAAIESVETAEAPIATSTVLVGGIIAAVLGPELALAGKSLLQTSFAGSFVLLSGVFSLALISLFFYRNVEHKTQEVEEAPRPFAHFFGQRTFWIALVAGAFGYALMSFVMTATPVSMNKLDGFSLVETKRVIQSHVLAMYVPSLFTGWLIRSLGLRKLIIAGGIVYLLTLVVALSGHALWQYWVSLILLGIGWNFLFIGGTVLLSTTYKVSERFRIQSLNDFIILGLQATASISAGWIVYEHGWDFLLWICLPFMVVLLSLALSRKF